MIFEKFGLKRDFRKLWVGLQFETLYIEYGRNPNFDSRIIGHSRRTIEFACSSSSITTQAQYSAKENLFSLIADQDRGLKTQKDTTRRSLIIEAIDALAELGRYTVTTTAESLSATWRLLWTTEKEQLFIIEKTYSFDTQTGDVLQVIDVEKKSLNNVITFPPDGVFFVRSDIEIASAQRVNFRFTSAVYTVKIGKFRCCRWAS